MGTSLCKTSATWTAGGAGAGGLWQATLASSHTNDTNRVFITIDPLGAASAFMFRAGQEWLRRLLLAVGSIALVERMRNAVRRFDSSKRVAGESERAGTIRE